MIRESFTKTAAGQRVLPLPEFAIAMLMGRQISAMGNVNDVVSPSALGTLRDPSAVHKPWRTVRSCLKQDWVTSHTFRKTMATLLGAQGLSARVGADQVGHAQISMTQDVYRGERLFIPKSSTFWTKSCTDYHFRNGSSRSVTAGFGSATV